MVQDTRNTYDSIAPEYGAAIDRLLEANPQIVQFALGLRERFLGMLPSKPIVLEIGGGNGRAMQHFLARGCRTVDADISMRMLLEARKNAPRGAFVCADMRHLPFSAEIFHGVWADGCIYHVPKRDLVQVFLGVFKLLRSEGVFSFNFKVGKNEGLDENPRSYGARPRYYAYYSVGEILQLLRSVGFKALSTDEYPEQILGEMIVHVWAQKP